MSQNGPDSLGFAELVGWNLSGSTVSTILQMGLNQKSATLCCYCDPLVPPPHPAPQAGLVGRHRLSLDRTERNSLGRKRSVPRTKTLALSANGHQGAVPPRPSSVRAGIAPQQSGGKRQMRPPGKALSSLFCPFSPCRAQHAGRTGARGVRIPGWSGTAGPPGGAMRAAAPGALGAPVPAHCAHPRRPPLRSSRKTWEQPPGTSQAPRAPAGCARGLGGEGQRWPRGSSTWPPPPLSPPVPGAPDAPG